MSVRAHVTPDYARFGVAVTVVRRVENAAYMLVPGDEATFDEWRLLNPDVVAEGSTYRFPDDVATALLDALLDHYRGGHDARQLRKDYDAERARVDKLIDVLVTPVSTLAVPTSTPRPT